MAKTKPDVKVRAKKSVSTNAIFKKAGKEALRQEQIGQRKYAIEKSAMAARNSKEQKAKHRSKQVTEHPLAEAFSGPKISISTPLYTR